jgi:hypothetical protein
MGNDEKVLRKLLEYGQWIETKQLDALLLEVWGNEHDASMHCNSLMRRGWIDYCCDGDWQIEFDQEELENILE